MYLGLEQKDKNQTYGNNIKEFQIYKDINLLKNDINKVWTIR